jgi:hypothetical protein
LERQQENTARVLVFGQESKFNECAVSSGVVFIKTLHIFLRRMVEKNFTVNWPLRLSSEPFRHKNREGPTASGNGDLSD